MYARSSAKIAEAASFTHGTRRRYHALPVAEGWGMTSGSRSNVFFGDWTRESTLRGTSARPGDIVGGEGEEGRPVCQDQISHPIAQDSGRLPSPVLRSKCSPTNPRTRSQSM